MTDENPNPAPTTPAPVIPATPAVHESPKSYNPTSKFFTAKERCWLTADKSKAVKDGDPDARYLLAKPGDRLEESATANIENIGEFFHTHVIATEAVE